MVGLAVGLLGLALPLGAGSLMPFAWGADPDPRVGVPVAAATLPPEPGTANTATSVPMPVTASPTAAPSISTPRPTPTATPDPTPTPTPTAGTGTPTPGGPVPPPANPPPPPQPVLLGPDSSGQVSNMVERYCDRHVGGSSWAQPRRDGSWECQRFLLSSRTVNMDVACSDTYGGGAYAQNPQGGDAGGWRCYRI